MSEPADDDAPHIGWWRAILTAIVVTLTGIAVLVYGVNATLTRLHGLARSTRVAIATSCFLVLLAVYAWVLRRLQRRGLI